MASLSGLKKIDLKEFSAGLNECDQKTVQSFKENVRVLELLATQKKITKVLDQDPIMRQIFLSLIEVNLDDRVPRYVSELHYVHKFNKIMKLYKDRVCEMLDDNSHPLSHFP
ncbi:MAG: hypothetical protein K1060chlam4_00089 [Candidatus Anoxychlamydiales bacterium]|nr:hypothetical protein [Candidatus Anoxychlamydiales bacterium]